MVTPSSLRTAAWLTIGAACISGCSSRTADAPVPAHLPLSARVSTSVTAPPVDRAEPGSHDAVTVDRFGNTWTISSHPLETFDDLECLAADRAFLASAAARAGLKPFVKARADLVGMSLHQVRRYAKTHGQSVRVVSVDGSCEARRDDLDPSRINVYLHGERVIWAASF